MSVYLNELINTQNFVAKLFCLVIYLYSLLFILNYHCCILQLNIHVVNFANIYDRFFCNNLGAFNFFFLRKKLLFISLYQLKIFGAK